MANLSALNLYFYNLIDTTINNSKLRNLRNRRVQDTPKDGDITLITSIFLACPSWTHPPTSKCVNISGLPGLTWALASFSQT